MIYTDQLVQLVDEKDTPIGTMEKMEAHLKPTLHRAVSILVFNSKGEWLIHRRAGNKYHSASLWTNACCTHPYPGEDYISAASRRLHEEMGMDAGDELVHLFDFVYKARVSSELTEHEYDRVFKLVSDEVPKPDYDEVESWRYVSSDILEEEMKQHPERFTEWFKIIFKRYSAI